MDNNILLVKSGKPRNEFQQLCDENEVLKAKLYNAELEIERLNRAIDLLIENLAVTTGAYCL